MWLPQEKAESEMKKKVLKKLLQQKQKFVPNNIKNEGKKFPQICFSSYLIVITTIQLTLFTILNM